jgi:hypothetical protein
MNKKSFFLRNVVAIAISLAAMTVFSACNKDDDDDIKVQLNGMGYQEAKSEGEPYILTCLQDGSCLKVFEKEDITDSIFFYDGSKMLGIKYDTDEMPVKIYTPDLLYVLTDYQGNSVTVSTYNKQGEKTGEETVTYDNSRASVQMNAKNGNVLRARRRNLCPGLIICQPKPLKNQMTRIMIARGGYRTKIFDEAANEAFWSSENETVLKQNYEAFAGNVATNGIIHYTGGIVWDKPVTPPTPTPTQKYCWVMTFTLACPGLEGVPTQTQSITECDLTEAEIKEVVRRAQETVNQSMQGSGCRGNYTYRRQ